MSGTKDWTPESERKGSRVTVRLSEAETKRLDAIRAPTADRPALQRATVLRAGLADMTAESFASDDVMAALVEPASSSGTCDRVHLDEATAHALRVELTRIGTNMNQIARRVNAGEHDVIAWRQEVASGDDELSLREQIEAFRSELTMQHAALGGTTS